MHKEMEVFYFVQNPSIVTSLCLPSSEVAVSPCVDRPTDLVFMVDGSERLGVENFERVRRFIEGVAQRLPMATSVNDTLRARLAVMQYGGAQQHQVTAGLTHDLQELSRRLEDMRYLDASSDVTSAITHAVSSVLYARDPRPRRQTRREAEIQFVFVTDGVTASEGLREVLGVMRKEQVVPAVVAIGNEVDKEVVMELAFKDGNAVFRGPDYSHLARQDFLDRFIRWVC